MDVASGRWRQRNESIIVLETRALTRLASTQQLFQKRCVALVENMAAALSFERRRSRNFLVLTCIRKLAGLCLALDLAFTVRWIPSEINDSDRPSRIHDPSDIRDKTMTNLLTVVKGRTHRDKMMAQRDPRETASMVQNRGHRVRQLWRRSANIAPVRPRRVRQLLQEGDLEENKMSRSTTLRRAKPLTRNS